MQTLPLRKGEVMGLLGWMKKESAGEKLLAKALVEFAEGDQKDALGDLLQGLIDMADGTKASVPLYNLQTRLANFNLIPAPAPAVAPIAKPPQAPAATTTPPATK
jgi:hypothetical protein